MMTDKERIDWLEKQDGSGVISDDNGRWAVPDSSFQNLTDSEGKFITDGPIDINVTFMVDASEWKCSIREAIDEAIRREKEELINRD